MVTPCGRRRYWIQWHLQGARLDPGSALRAVRDDVNKEGGALSGMAFCFFDVIPGPPQAEPGIQRLGCNGLLRALSTWAAQALVGWPCGPSGMTSRERVRRPG